MTRKTKRTRKITTCEDQEAEASRAALELGLGGAGAQMGGDAAELRRASRSWTTTATPRPLTTEVPRKTAVGAAAEAVAEPAPGASACFSARERLPGQGRLVQEEVLGREQAGVPSPQAPG